MSPNRPSERDRFDVLRAEPAAVAVGAPGPRRLGLDDRIMISGGIASEPHPLVGRSPEQRLLREELAAAASGHGRLVVIGGEAGIGKTTLARDLAKSAADDGMLVLVGHCYDLTATPPYGPWLDLAADYRRHDDLPPLPAALASGRIDEIE